MTWLMDVECMENPAEVTLTVTDVQGVKHVYEDIALRNECPFSGVVEPNLERGTWTCPLCGTEHEIEE